MHYTQVIVCNPLLSAGGGELSLQPNFQKGGGGGLTGFQLLEAGCWERGGGCNFHIKNKLKSETFNDKKSLYAKIFFSIITKNSNREILPKNFVTFKRQDGIKDEKLIYFGGSLKDPTFRGGFTKNQYRGGGVA